MMRATLGALLLTLGGSTHCALALERQPPLPAVNESFVFDGSHSDLAQQLYRRSLAGATLPPLNVSYGSNSSTSATWLPDAVVARLRRLRVPSFDLLPGVLQRALLWDAGFVPIERTNRKSPPFVQVWTTDGRPMSDIAVSRQEWKSSNTIDTCIATVCTQPNRVAAYKAFDCACDPRAALVAKCAVANTYRVFDKTQLESGELEPALWATGSDPNATPDPILRERRCAYDSSTNTSQNDTDGGTASSSHVFRSTLRAAVYSIDTGGLTGTSRVCSSERFESLVIPCLRLSSINNTQQARLREPRPSLWLDNWLAAYRSVTPPAVGNSQETPSPSSLTPSSSFNMALLVAIVVSSLFVVALVGLLTIRRPSVRNTSRGTPANTFDGSVLLTPPPEQHPPQRQPKRV